MWGSKSALSKRFAATCGIIAMLLAGSPAQAGCTYILTILPPGRAELPNGEVTDFANNHATGVNNAGQVTLNSDRGQFPPLYHAFIWSKGAGLQDLYPLLFVAGINNAGRAVGYNGPLFDLFAYLWSPTSGAKHLGDLSQADGNFAQAQGINNKAQVVGFGSTFEGRHAFLWQGSTGMRDLGTLPGGDYSEGTAINDVGEVVGFSTSPAGARAFLWTSAAGMRDLGSLPGGQESRASSINNSGQVVGTAGTAVADHAFRWSEDTGMLDLGSLIGAAGGSNASGINNRGQVVGASQTMAGDHAFVWDETDGMVDLNTRIDPSTFVLETAAGISDSGYIAGSGYDPVQGIRRAFLLTPDHSKPVK